MPLICEWLSTNISDSHGSESPGSPPVTLFTHWAPFEPLLCTGTVLGTGDRAVDKQSPVPVEFLFLLDERDSKQIGDNKKKKARKGDRERGVLFKIKVLYGGFKMKVFMEVDILCQKQTLK